MPYMSFSSVFRSFIILPSSSTILRSWTDGLASFMPLTKSIGSNMPSISLFRAVRLGLISSLAICDGEG